MNIQVQPKYKDKEKWLEYAKENRFNYEIDEFAFSMDEKKQTEMINYYKKTGLVTSMHGAFIDINPVSNEPLVAEASIKRCEESCKIANSLGAKNIVFHCSEFPYLRGMFLEKWCKKAADFYCNLARKYKLKIYIENCLDLDPEPLYKFMKQCEVPYVRACLDFGHANYSREPFETWIDVLGKYIGYVHFSDNLGMFDDHLSLGDGILPWDIVDDLMGYIGDDTLITLETGRLEDTKKSVEYLKKNNLILHLNTNYQTDGNDADNKIKSDRAKKTKKLELSDAYFDTSLNRELVDFDLSSDEKRNIQIKKIRSREEHYQKRNEAMRDIFSRYLSNEIVHRALEKPDSLRLGGSKKELTILMSDLHGFTQISEKLQAEELIRILNHYFGVMMEIIHRYHGTIIDMVGDGMLVAFGMFEDEDIHADKAIGAAIEMQCYMQDVNKWNKENGYPNLHMGIGINTGHVVVGNIGSSRHIKYGIVGRNVNICSRIESYTYNGQILISQSTKDRVQSEIEIASEEKVYPKGSSNVITLYHVVGINGTFKKYFTPKKLDYINLDTKEKVKFSFVYEKHRAVVLLDGFIKSISETGAIFETDEQVQEFDNIVIDIDNPLFCKILNKISDNTWELQFTSIPVNFENWLYKLTHK